jgi:hypothetical protein
MGLLRFSWPIWPFQNDQQLLDIKKVRNTDMLFWNGHGSHENLCNRIKHGFVLFLEIVPFQWLVPQFFIINSVPAASCQNQPPFFINLQLFANTGISVCLCFSWHCANTIHVKNMRCHSLKRWHFNEKETPMFDGVAAIFMAYMTISKWPTTSLYEKN